VLCPAAPAPGDAGAVRSLSAGRCLMVCPCAAWCPAPGPVQRIHYGAFVAEAEFLESPQTFVPLIEAQCANRRSLPLGSCSREEEGKKKKACISASLFLHGPVHGCNLSCALMPSFGAHLFISWCSFAVSWYSPLMLSWCSLGAFLGPHSVPADAAAILEHLTETGRGGSSAAAGGGQGSRLRRRALRPPSPAPASPGGQCRGRGSGPRAAHRGGLEGRGGGRVYKGRSGSRWSLRWWRSCLGAGSCPSRSKCKWTTSSDGWRQSDKFKGWRNRFQIHCGLHHVVYLDVCHASRRCGLA